MKVQVLNPMPWSAIMEPDGRVQLTLSSGPRESISLRFPTLGEFCRFEKLVSDSATTMLGSAVYHARVLWQSPDLAAYLMTREHSPGVDHTDPEQVTESALRRAGFVYDPRTGWLAPGI